jgi:Tol biopolymer transport system component
VSPCGDKIAFIGRDANLWVQDISHGLHASQPEMVVQAGPFETLADIGWRGCNDLLYSEALDFGIRQINLTTRDSIVLAESDRFPSASRDGSVVVYHGVYSLMKLEHGDTTRIFTQDSTESIRAVEVSPDGKHVVYERMILGYAPDSAWIVQLYSLVLVDVATGFKRELQITGRDPAWLSDDRIVFCRMIRHDPEGNSQVWTCDTSGTDLQQLTNLNMLWK